MRIRAIECVDCGKIGLCVGFTRITDHECSGQFYDVVEAEYDEKDYAKDSLKDCGITAHAAQTNLLLMVLSDINDIFNSDTDWEWKYDRIFHLSKSAVQPLLSELNINLDYYDPDTTEEEDVTAYYNAVMQIKQNLELEGY